jgi:hypothetical protein
MDGADKKRAAFKQRGRRERKVHLAPPVLYLSPSRRALILAPDPLRDQRRGARLSVSRVPDAARDLSPRGGGAKVHG